MVTFIKKIEMNKGGSVVIIEDDIDDQEMLQNVFEDVKNRK